MKKNLYVAVCILFVAVVSGCGKSQPVSTPETAAETESVVTAETEESVIETETISEVETPITKVETEPVVTEDETETVELTETEPETVLSETEEATVEEVAISEMDAQMYAQTNVNIRASYSRDSEKLGVLQRGASVHVTGVTEDGKWYRVDNSDNGSGFISGSYLGVSKPADPAPAPAVETPASTIETPAPEAPAPVVNPGDEDLPSMEELTGKPSTSDYDLNSIPIEDDGLTAEERAEKYEHDPGFGGILHAA